MSDDASRHDDAAHGADEHATPHLPPPSFAPINVAFSLAVIFVGFLKEVRATLGPIMWVVGLVWLIVACALWARAARTEYLQLPEDANH
jgi:hypothetical protein